MENNNKINEQTKMYYRGTTHKLRFIEKLHKLKNCDRKMLPVIYLLSANNKLWNQLSRIINNNKIEFDKLVVNDLDTEGYMLYRAAQDLYCGTNHMSIADLSDHEITSASVFTLICNAILLRKYGKIPEKGGME